MEAAMSDILLEDTNASAIAAGLLRARRAAGSPAMGMVMTLVVVTPDDDCEEAVAAATGAAREHPSRLLAVVVGSKRGASRIDAEVRTGAKGSAGELAVIRLSGPVAGHAESVVLPLLLPDSPVVVWWPTDAPDSPGDDPLGRLGTRRITDAAAVPRNRTRAMLTQCRNYTPGNTDLAWTRVTPWRALLAAALDQAPGKVGEIELVAERTSPSADLLGAWLSDRLKAPVTRKRADVKGISSVRLTTPRGDVRIARDREEPAAASLAVPAQPDRPVSLRRRELPELLAEELRRLDPDEVYESTVRALHRQEARAEGSSAAKASPTSKSKKKSTKKADKRRKTTASRTRRTT
jgi:glucose-6-phosphate dehydrogenase assembly protein OpcA